MAVAIARLWVALDEGVRRDRFRSGITLIGIQTQSHIYFRLRARDHLVRNSDRLIVKRASAKIRMQRNR